jgi:hypothetical protein
LVAAAATVGTAWAQAPSGGRLCGTPGAKAAPVSHREDGRGPRGLGMSAMVIPPPSVSATPLTPPAAPPVAVASNPPAPSGPPSLPGIMPPPAAREEEKKKEGKDRKRVEAIQAEGEIPEGRLLDIGIELFDPGLGEDDRQKLAEQGLSPELRRAESRYMAFHLKKTMEGTGNWGAVRVLPGPGEGVDVFVRGRILKSTGKDLALEVEATDATGRRWLKRRYAGAADLAAYRPERAGQHEPFQDVYNEIANDILEERDRLDAGEITTVRRVAGMRFAHELAPEAFDGYVGSQGSRYVLRRLPAEGDPMILRVASIRDRDQMLVDTLNDYYLSFYERMGTPYANWRQYSYQEQAALDKIKRESTLKKILGGAGMLAGLVLSGSDSSGGRLAGDIALLGGMTALQAGMNQSRDKAVHVAALKELAQSADGEVAPLLVEVEGHQVRLSGSAEKQFTEWRQLLRRLFAIETGVPGDPNSAPEVTPPPPSD